MQSLRGGCYCGNIRLQVELTHQPDHYHPRACDCDFCRKHGAAYLSDPLGSLGIRIADSRHSTAYRQGNELAEMLLCTRCGVLVGALYRSGGRIYGTVNANALEGPPQFGAEQPVSPKELAADEKIARWMKLWFGNVTLE